jgi:hypothetical protein
MAFSIPRLVAVLFAVIGVGLGGASLGTTNWYSITLPVGTVTRVTQTGLFQQCDDPAPPAGRCSDITFQDFTSTQCSRTGSDQKQRITAVLGLCIAGLALALLSAILGGVAFAAGNVFATIAVVLSVLSASAIGIGMALFVYTIENWYFCDKTPCDFYGLPGCTNSLGYSFILMGVALFLVLVSFILHIVSILTSSEDEPAAQQQPQQQQQYGNNSEPYYGNTSQSPQQSSAYGKPAPPAGGDWVYDETSGLYWSQAEYLYLDTTNGQYFDPTSQMWYDPASQQWYNKQ